MVIKNILQIGNPKLRQKSQLVSLKELNSPQIKRIIKNLKDSFNDSMVVGMSAPQISHNLQIFVAGIKETKYRKGYKADPLKVYINPKIVWYSKKKTVLYEGCVSVSGIFGPVLRPEKIKIIAYDEKGNKFFLKANGLLAKVIQHEYDHLYGILFTDKLTDVKKMMSREEYIKARNTGKI